jgi:hypothetical protein
MHDGLEYLRQFGNEAERHRQPWIAVGGFVVPGDAVATVNSRSQEKHSAGQRIEGPALQAGTSRASGTSGPPGQAAAASKAAHPIGALIGGRTGAREFDELAAFYPDATISASSPTFDILTMRLGLFSNLPYRARLFLEVPHFSPTLRPVRPTLIPDIRVWSYWDAGAEAGLPLTSHHEYPDGSMCVCMAADWMRGRDLIVDYVNFCVCWIAKMMHDQLIGSYPGKQHIPAYLRLQRDRPHEFCGCGLPRRYRRCHLASDLDFKQSELLAHRREDRRRYFDELASQRRRTNPLELIGRVVSPNAA